METPETAVITQRNCADMAANKSMIEEAQPLFPESEVRHIGDFHFITIYTRTDTRNRLSQILPLPEYNLWATLATILDKMADRFTVDYLRAANGSVFSVTKDGRTSIVALMPNNDPQIPVLTIQEGSFVFGRTVEEIHFDKMYSTLVMHMHYQLKH